MSKKTVERPVFPFTGIVGQEEICALINIIKSIIKIYIRQ